MKKISIVISSALLLSACGGSSAAPKSLPSVDQKAVLKEIQKSLLTAQIAVPLSTIEHADARQDDDDDMLGDDEARAQMQAQLREAVQTGDCKVTKTGDLLGMGSSDPTPGPKSATLYVGGPQCPIIFDLAFRIEMDGARKGSQSGKVSYAVTQTPAGEKYRKLNDVDAASFTTELYVVTIDSGKSYTISGSASGKVRSQKHGELIEKATVFANFSKGAGSLRADDSYALPGFSLDRSITATKTGTKTDTQYFVNGQKATSSEYSGYGEFLLPVSDPTK